MKKIINSYIEKARQINDSMDASAIEKLAVALNEARSRGSLVFIAGNGGSASTASHFATDLSVGSLKFNKQIKAYSLCDSNSSLTATANDVDYKFVFSKQVEVLSSPGDLLILISASGNSENLLHAAESAVSVGADVYSMTGFDGGKLKKITAGRNVHIQTSIGDYGLVEDAHLAICHILTECARS